MDGVSLSNKHMILAVDRIILTPTQLYSRRSSVSNVVRCCPPPQISRPRGLPAGTTGLSHGAGRNTERDLRLSDGSSGVNARADTQF
jgi:hypothetical protein